ncbi:MAG: DUF503 domain-containing protein [Pseudomonadota bacterium]
MLQSAVPIHERLYARTMVVGVGFIRLMIHESSSLKDKRRVVKSILGKVRSKFDVSIAEIGDQDKWQRCSLGYAFVTNESGMAHRMLESVVDYVEKLHLAEVTEYNVEIVHY